MPNLSKIMGDNGVIYNIKDNGAAHYLGRLNSDDTPTTATITLDGESTSITAKINDWIVLKTKSDAFIWNGTEWVLFGGKGIDTLSTAQLNAINSKMTRKQAITNGVYLVEEPPKAVTHPSTGNPYIRVSFSGYLYNFDSVTGVTSIRYGIIYCNDGTAGVSNLRLENVDGVHIIKFDDVTGYDLAVSGTNPVNAVGFAQYQDADGVTSDVLYTKNLGGDYRMLNAPADIVALQQTIGDINSVLEEVL